MTDANILEWNNSFLSKTENKSKNDRILPNKVQEEIRPKLKQTKNEEITESPLEKLRRLENGMSMGILNDIHALAIYYFDINDNIWISFLAKPTEVKPVDEELVISELPSYDLPTQRQKTALEPYENLGKDSTPRQKKAMEEYPDEWERLKKPDESDDTINPIILGKGRNPGKFILRYDIIRDPSKKPCVLNK